MVLSNAASLPISVTAASVVRVNDFDELKKSGCGANAVVVKVNMGRMKRNNSLDIVAVKNL